MNEKNRQRGDVKVNYLFESYLVNSFIRNSHSRCLDLGSGIAFNIEKVINSEVPHVDFDCIDIQPEPEICPSFITYYCKSVEEEIQLDRKYDAIISLECIEHIDKTDMLLKNCYNNLDDNGLLYISVPNLASIFSRIELLFGFQPHILEVSNECGVFGVGFFGKLNGSSKLIGSLDKRIGSLHHIRGITYRAMCDMLEFHGFEIVDIVGHTSSRYRFLAKCPSISPDNLFVCKKRVCSESINSNTNI